MANVLVVDDSSTVRNEVGNFLGSNGFQVALAVDGHDGLAKLRQDSGIKLVVCDVNMPNMDGLTMVERVRSELGNHKVNIVMLTTESSPADEGAGQGGGGEGVDREAVQWGGGVGVVSEIGCLRGCWLHWLDGLFLGGCFPGPGAHPDPRKATAQPPAAPTASSAKPLIKAGKSPRASRHTGQITNAPQATFSTCPCRV